MEYVGLVDVWLPSGLLYAVLKSNAYPFMAMLSSEWLIKLSGCVKSNQKIREKDLPRHLDQAARYSLLISVPE